MIPPHVLRELRYIEIATSKGIRTARVGPYTSRKRGSGLDFDQHVRSFPAHALEIADRMAERLAIAQILDRLFHRALGHAETDGCV